MPRFQEFIFDNAKNTRGTFNILLNIWDGVFAKLVNGLKPLAINMNSSAIDLYQGYECVTESTIKNKVA